MFEINNFFYISKKGRGLFEKDESGLLSLHFSCKYCGTKAVVAMFENYSADID